MHTKKSIALSLASFFAAALPALAAAGGSNFTPITINDNANASLYPSTAEVTTSAPITSISVRLIGMQHARLSDLTVLLVSPTGKTVQLMANVEGAVANQPDVFFAEPGESMNGQTILSDRVFRPTVVGQPVAMPAPAPALPYATNYASIIGDNMLGTWSLYIRDNATGISGNISGGWAIAFNGPGAVPFLPEFTYQGFVTQAGAPVSGVRDIRLEFWNSPYSTFGGDSRGTFTAPNVQVTNGRFTVRVSREGQYLTDDRQLFVEVGVREPGGSNFTILSPRQQITATPYALFAKSAEFATFADSVLSVPWTSVTGVPANVANPFNPWQSVGGTNIQNTNTGNLLIGTASGTSKLTVAGTIESTTGGIKFPNGTIQTTAATGPSVVASATHSVDISTLNANTQSIQTVTIAGASFQAGDVVVVSPDVDFPVGLTIAYARITSGNQVRFVVANLGSVAVNPAAATYSIKVIR